MKPLDSSLALLGILAPPTRYPLFLALALSCCPSHSHEPVTRTIPLISDRQSSERVRTAVMEQVSCLSSWVRATDRSTPVSSTHLVARLLLEHLLSALVALANPSLMPRFHRSIIILILQAMETASLDSQLFNRCNVCYFCLLIGQIPPST